MQIARGLVRLSQFPEAEIFEVDDYAKSPSRYSQQSGVRTDYKLTNKNCYPNKTLEI